MTDNIGHILVVDDHKTNRLKMSLAVKMLGYTTEMAEDGRQALDMLRAESFDLVLLDIVMPVLDGYQVLEEMKADSTLREIPVVVISAQQEMESVVKGIELGAEDYLPKAFDPILLKARVGACLEKKRLRDQERKLQKQIQKANRRMERELALAGEIQASFLPRQVPDLPGWQLSATLQPAREASGDFYDFIPLPEGRWGIVMADVMGKGAGAALYMALSCTLIRTYAVECPGQPELLLSAVNRRTLQDTSADQFVTVFYGILDPVTGMLVYSSAGHCPALHFCQDDQDVRALARTGIPLGIFEDQTWGQETVQLDRGDLFLLYTDGITEAHTDPTLLFDQEGLVESVQATLSTAGSQPPSAQEVQEGILADVHSFLGSTPQPDDIALTILLRDQ